MQLQISRSVAGVHRNFEVLRVREDHACAFLGLHWVSEHATQDYEVDVQYTCLFDVPCACHLIWCSSSEGRVAERDRLGEVAEGNEV